nr:GAF domain-containing protein [Chthoniobacterales bacterium]
TPLTVCLAVMGRHVPSLRFLSVLLSEEQALAPHEECYHRLLAQSLTEASELAEAHLKANSLTSLYDGVLIPALILAENDARSEELDPEQQGLIHQQMLDIIEDVGELPPTPSKVAADVTVAEDTPPVRPVPAIRVRCLPARAYRDELAGIMLTQVLIQQGIEAESLPAALASGELVENVRKAQPDAVCISVVSPSTLIHARHLAGRLRAALPDLQIVVGVWGATENLTEAGERLRSSGASEVVVSFAEAVVQLSKISFQVAEEWNVAPIPPNEDERLAVLESLKLTDCVPDQNFDRITAKLTRLFEVPIALITLIDREHQWFKAQTGLPAELAAEGSSRDVSVCGHVVASNDLLVVEDLARDRRFANNPLLKERGLRFYAGAPLRINGLPIGSVCILDTKPRRMTDKEKRLLEIAAEDVVDEILRRPSESPETLPSAA